MESLGQKLREAREQHNFSLEQVARDTHISKQYLEALEAEDFSMIPGETYVIGFLRNYAEYLTLNPEELVALYKNIQIQEQPLPMTELLEPRRARLSGRLLAVMLIVLIVLGGGSYLLYRLLSAAAQRPAAAEETAGSAGSERAARAEFLFQDEAVTRWFNLEETILVSLNGDSYAIRLAAIGKKLTLAVPGGTLELNIGQDRQLDLNRDGRNDLRLLLNDLDATAQVKRASLGLYKITKASLPQVAVTPPAQEAAGGQVEPAARPQPEGVAPAAPAAAAPAAVATAAVATAAAITIAGADAPSPFRVTISFRGYCLFRYLVDKNIREERFFHKGESFSLDARNEVQLWISNAGAVRLMVSGREIEVGRPGAVVTRQIQWSRDETAGNYLLQIVPIE